MVINKCFKCGILLSKDYTDSYCPKCQTEQDLMDEEARIAPGGACMNLKGKRVEFEVVFRGTCGHKTYQGIIKKINQSGTGVVIRGENIRGLFNRPFSEINLIEQKNRGAL